MASAQPTEAGIKKGLKRGRVLVSWRLLRSVGNSRAAKLTVLIPLVGYLILLNDDFVTHLTLAKDMFGDAADATFTRLLSIYVGLVFIAAASLRTVHTSAADPQFQIAFANAARTGFLKFNSGA
jgi:hypothetical protein